MILRSLYLHIGELGLPKEYTYDFKKRSRYICNWVEREVLKKLQFESDGFDRIVVVLCSQPRATAYLNTSNVACAEIGFDRKQIDAVSGRDLAKLQVSMLKMGIKKCADGYTIPKKELNDGLDEFVAQGMKNEWLHKKRVFKEHALSAALTCKMTQSAFSLWLTIAREKTILVEKAILETEPDEIVFHTKFKDIEIADGNLVVTPKIGRPIWSKPLAELKSA